MRYAPAALGLPLLLLLLAIAGGCASKPASSISLAVVDDVSLAAARADGEAYLGSMVRWGGVVTEIENKADMTWVFVVGRALEHDEKPILDSASDGRFVARFNGFIDPLVYKAGRPLTVVGTIEGSMARTIGEYDYRFPIVAVRDSHLWADPLKVQRNYYPYPPPWWYSDYYYYHPYPFPYRRW